MSSFMLLVATLSLVSLLVIFSFLQILFFLKKLVGPKKKSGTISLLEFYTTLNVSCCGLY